MRHWKAEQQVGRKRIGRPIKPPAPGERTQIGVQVTPGMKMRLEAAAEQNHRSLSREAEVRLERSFDREDLLPQVLGLAYGEQGADLLMKVGQSWLRGTVKTKDEILASGRTLDEVASDNCVFILEGAPDEAAVEDYVFILEGDHDEVVERKANDVPAGAARALAVIDTRAQAATFAKRGKIAKSGARGRKSPPYKEEPES